MKNCNLPIFPRYFPVAATFLLLLSGACCVRSTAADAPADKRANEKRVYDVFVDDKPSGQYQLQFVDTPGATDVTSDSEVNTKVLFVHYKYVYHGHEVYQSKHLQSFDSNCDDGGKHIVVTAQRSGDKLTLKVNGKAQDTMDGATLTSSYWFLPEPGKDQFDEKYLEVDSGRLFNAHLQLIGEEPIKIGDRTEVCKHYRLTGGDKDDLWYDKENRMVKQTEMDQGHHTRMQARSIEH
jgi:hypothetical protein